MDNITIHDIVDKEKAKRRLKYSKWLLVWALTVFLLCIFVLAAGTQLHYRYHFLPYVAAMSFLLLLAEARSKFVHNGLQRFIVETFEYRVALLIVCTAFAVIFVLLYFGLVYTELCQNAFADARIEWFVWLTFAIGLVGAYWAITAKMRADEAFLASSESFIQARNTLLSFGGSVDFDDIANEESDRMLPSLIKHARSELIVVAPLPLVGFFRNPVMGKTIVRILAAKLHTLADADCSGWTRLILINFDRPTNEQYLNQWQNEEKANIDALTLTVAEKGNRKKQIDDSVAEFKDELSGYENAVASINRKKSAGKTPTTVIETVNHKVDVGLRFVVSIDRNKRGEITRQQALVWVVSDFGPTQVTTFKSAGFSTGDGVIIGVLARLADDYTNSLPLLQKK